MTTRKLTRTFVAGTSACALALAGTVLVGGPALAAPLSATDQATLNAAITTANADSAPDVITLGADITLTGNLLPITEDLEIVGNSYEISTDAPGYTIFSDVGATANITITFTGVKVTGTVTADAIDTNFSNVTITDSEFDTAQVDVRGTDIAVVVTGSKFNNAGNDNDGFHVDAAGASTASISTSSADDNEDEGFDFDLTDTSSLNFTNNTASGNEDNGVEVSAGTFAIVTIGHVTSEDNGVVADDDGSGIEIDTEDDATATVTDVHVNRNADEGLDANADDRSTISVSDSDASGNRDDGFDADTDDSDSKVEFTNCDSTTNGSAGFDFNLDSGTITGSRLTATGNDDAGLDASSESSSAMTVSDSTFAGTTDGPGVHLEPIGGSTNSLQRITASGNQGGDGGFGGINIDDEGFDGTQSKVTISDSTSDGNNSPGLAIGGEGPDGGATSIDIMVTGSTLSNNTFIGGAGIIAVLHDTSSLAVVNSTISGNEGGLDGTVIVGGDDANASFGLFHSTITDNTVSSSDGTGGVYLSGVQFLIAHSIIAGNTAFGAPSDLLFDTATTPSGTVDYSLVQASTGAGLAAVNAGTGNLKNMSAQLGPLANNGGHTLTHLPQEGSPVINAGNPAISGAPATDQRGQTRIVGTIDLGAVETQVALAATGADSTPLIIGGSLILGLGILIFVVARRKRADR